MLVELEPYTADHYYDVVQWFQERKVIAPTQYDLPRNGFVVPGVAAGFLISTDTKTALIDFMVSNPKAERIFRANAIDKIARALISKAKKLGYNFVKCDSQIHSIQKKALSLGFNNVGTYDSFYKEI